MNDVSKALLLATSAHDGQFDKSGLPYILHPLEVMRTCMGDTQAMCVALLHDIVEDTYVTLSDIQGHFGNSVRDDVDALTRRKNEDYTKYIIRISKASPVAIKVKLADLKHNLDYTRINWIMTEQDLNRMRKYVGAYNLLTQKDWDK